MSVHLLAVTPPFDFGHTLRFLGGFPPGQGEQDTAGELRKATRLNGQTVGSVLREEGADLSCELFPERPLKTEEVEALTARLRFFLGLDEDMSAFTARAAEDVAFQPVLEVLHGFHQPRFLTPFEAACWAILSQRLPMPQARKLKRELSLRCGGLWEGLPAFPEPADVARLSPAELLAVVPNDRKARALAGLAQAFGAVSTADLASRPVAEVKAWLLGLYGVGGWSALFVLLRGLGRVGSVLEQPDDSPLTRELLKAARPVYGELTPQQLWERARWYGAQQGQWAIYLRSRATLMGQKESA